MIIYSINPNKIRTIFNKTLFYLNKIFFKKRLINKIKVVFLLMGKINKIII